MSGAALTAGRRTGTAVLVNAPTATLDVGASVAGGRALVVLDADATRRFDPGIVDAMVLQCDGGTPILLFVWRERFDWGGFDLFELSRFDRIPGHCYAGQTPNRTF
jgi:hypothetical protein